MEEFRRPPRLNLKYALAWVFPLMLAVLSCANTARSRAAEPPPEEKTMVVRNLALPGAFEVENLGPDIDLAWAVSLERETKGAWTAEVTDLTLIEHCGQALPTAGCLRLAHGAKLHPVRWNGLSCGSQCPANCRANVFLGPGRFRFVVSQCDGKRTFPGPAFEMPTHDKWK